MRKLYQRIRVYLLDLKIRKKLLSIYLLVTVIPILLVGVYLNYAIRNVVIDNALYEAESNVDKMEMRLNTILTRVTNISDLIYLNRDMYSLLNEQYLNNLEIYHAYNRYPIFDDYLKYYDEIENIQFYMEKDMITNSQFIHAESKHTETDWYQEALENRGKITWVYKQEEWTNDAFLTLTRAVFDDTNQFLGILCIYISPDKLREVSKGELHDVFMTIDHETVVYHQNGSFIGGTMPFSIEGVLANQSNYVLDETYQDKEVKVTVHSFQPTKSLFNEIQIASIVPVEELMQKPNDIFLKGFFVILGALAVSILSYQFFIRSFNERIDKLKQAMFKVAKGRFNIPKRIIGKDEIGEVYDELYHTTQSIQKLIDEVYVHKIKEERWRRKQKESDFKMLSSQINPHFLYNTLEMIRMKAMMNKDKEVAMIIQKLSKMMRAALKQTDQQISLQEELDLITTYLEIQSLRFGEKLHYRMEVDVDASHYKIFPLLIQPIVENAIIHGIEPKEGTGNIAVIVTAEGDVLQIDVMDNGIGMSEKTLQAVKDRLVQGEQHADGKRIGVKNVYQRIQLYYGMSYGLEIESQALVGTTVTIRLPCS